MRYPGHVLLSSTIVAFAASAAAAQAPDKIQIGGDGPVFPESITGTSDGSLFTSSVGMGRIFKAAPGATEASEWSAKQSNGPQSILGVLADQRTGTLWACYSDMALSKGDSGQPAVLRAFDLSSGKVKKSYQLPAQSFCNDIATTSNGTVYATDTHGGRIMRLAAGAKQLATWLQDKRLVGVDGIALGEDGWMYLTNVKSNGLFKLAVAGDGKPGEMIALKTSEPVKGPDGLRAGRNGHLYLAENAAGKVDELTVNGDQVTVKTIKSGYDAPTSTTTHGDTLYVVEAKIQKYGKGGRASPFYVYALQAPADSH
jgi:sugar lactone lactonase YvrE